MPTFRRINRSVQYSLAVLDWGGKVAAYFFAACAALAGLAAIIALTAHPWTGWRHDLFNLLVGGAFITVTLGLLSGGAAAVSAIRRRQAKAIQSTPEVVAIPAPAEQPMASPVNPDEFKPRHQESGAFPDNKVLTFGFNHINEHPGAYMALGSRRCIVVNPSGVETSATGTSRYFQYPYEFENAPAVRPGLYRFRFEGRLTNGEWVFITKGEHEVNPPPPLIVTITDGNFETWKHIALIVELRVKITNTTDKAIRIRSFGFSYDAEGKASLHYALSRENYLELEREIFARKDRQHYGIPLEHHAVVPADESVTGWVVSQIARPDTGGIPAITVAVKDQLGNEYRATRPKEEAKTYN